ncbi:MAG: sigma-54-dependent Fis family transcriptional regulator [Deltaproteobacteria bacterium]|nr:sigma-54-dependent Fis family transcriptional regulator [Deltaproteobacteria bacterium]MBN2688882.1 sigma-54-dependent Fis family transcriptional regulator [Deltaproteobacteria bacterium]
MYRYKILIVDDDKLLQNSLTAILSDNYDVLVAGTGEDAVALLRDTPVDLVLLDIRLPGIDGIETLRAIQKRDEDFLVVMMTAYEDIATVVTSMKMGAHDYLVKPLDIDELEIIIERALTTLKLKKEVEELRRQCRAEFHIDNVIGESRGMKDALEQVGKVARSYDTTVLIEGETGTGKEVIARAIHYQSIRIGKPFISINCGAISRDLVESELFGYEKGTFTGGLHDGKKGKIELAHEGSLFLDEISELIPSAQVKLLRFLENKDFYPVGGTEKKKVDVRVIAATNISLEKAIAAGSFREDLFYRMNIIRIYLPPLRERREDIIPLVLFYMNMFNLQCGKNFQSLSKSAEKMLLGHRWAGNVRELRNTIERIMIMEDDSEIRARHLAFLNDKGNAQVHPRTLDISIPPVGINLEELNRNLIIEALKQAGGNKTEAARLLGMSRPTIIYRINKFGIEV